METLIYNPDGTEKIEQTLIYILKSFGRLHLSAILQISSTLQHLRWLQVVQNIEKTLIYEYQWITVLKTLPAAAAASKI